MNPGPKTWIRASSCHHSPLSSRDSEIIMLISKCGSIKFLLHMQSMKSKVTDRPPPPPPQSPSYCQNVLQKKTSHVCKESPTASRAILHRHTVSRGSGGTRGNNGKRVFKSQRWICVMIVNDVFPCPLRQTVRPNLYSCFLFVTVRATDVCPCLLLGQSMSH